MPDKRPFEIVLKDINKCETRLDKYVLPSTTNPIPLPKEVPVEENQSEPTEEVVEIHKKKSKEEPLSEEQALQLELLNARNLNLEKFAAFADQQVKDNPKICVWDFMPQEAVQNLIKTTNKQEIRRIIHNKMQLEYPKGAAHILYIELMYSVVQFCQKSKFNIKQAGTVLSIFYLTHKYFLSSLYTTPEKAYKYFKDYMILHCFDCPPDSIELFNYEESKKVMLYFCKLYLRNLPLIRLLTLPNFAFCLNYEIPPDPFEGKADKGKKGKK